MALGVAVLSMASCAERGVGPAAGGGFDVHPAGETTPVPSLEDAADDPAIWVHPADPAKSLILGTDKKSGLFVYDLSGAVVQSLPVGRLNNVDVRYGFGRSAAAKPGEGADLDVAAATNRTTRTIDFFLLDRDGRVTPAGSVASRFDDPYGLTLYRSGRSRELYVIACDKSGLVRQWRLGQAGATVTAAEVREFHVGTQAEGMATDDRSGRLFIAEEGAGIWVYDAEPVAELKRTLVDAVGPLGSLVADVEGLSVVYGEGGAGYLVASSQGDNSYRVYDVRPPYSLMARFRIAAGNGMNGAEETDGLDVVGQGLGARFPGGLLVVQDGQNEPRSQNFKLVRWEEVALRATPALKAKAIPARSIP